MVDCLTIAQIHCHNFYPLPISQFICFCHWTHQLLNDVAVIPEVHFSSLSHGFIPLALPVKLLEHTELKRLNIGSNNTFIVKQYGFSYVGQLPECVNEITSFPQPNKFQRAYFCLKKDPIYCSHYSYVKFGSNLWISLINDISYQCCVREFAIVWFSGCVIL